MISREQQIAHSGAVACLEGLLKYKYINEKDIPEVKKRLEIHESMITAPDILHSLEMSKH